MAKYFQIPFAMNGDRKEIPTDKQDDGSISFDEGYGADYEKNKQVDPTAKDISRQDFNGVLHDITGAIGEIQRSGVATWTNEISYNKGATIIHNGAVYTSNINANKNEPPHTSWSSLDLSVYRKKDDLLFNGMMQVQATDDVGTGVFLLDKEGIPRGQMTYNSGGLQFAQHDLDGKSRTYTFPLTEGELLVDGSFDKFKPNMLDAKIMYNSSDNVYAMRKQIGGGSIMTMNRDNSIYLRIQTGNLAAPSLPSGSENEAWELMRVTTVRKLIAGFMYHAPDSTLPDKVISSTFITNLPFITSESRSLRYKEIRSGVTLEATLQARSNGILRILYFSTPSSKPVNLDINGAIYTFDSKVLGTAPRVTYHDVYVGFDELNITITSDFFNLVGFDPVSNTFDTNYIVDNSNDWCYYLDVAEYISSTGASDYAIQSGTNRLWAGSYHGGERKLKDPMWLVNNTVYNHSELPDFTVSNKISLIQNTELKWGSGESLKTNTITTMLPNGVNVFGAFYDVNIKAMTAYTGMSTTDPSFTISVGGKYAKAVADESYDLGMTNSVMQINPDNGRKCISIFSKPPVIATNEWGTRLSYVKRNYAKIYPAFIYRQTSSFGKQPVQLPEYFDFSFTKIFM